MNRLVRLVPVMAIVVSSGSVAPLHATGMRAPDASAARVQATDHRNAALYYWRALYTLDRDFQRESGDALASDRDAGWAPNPAITGKLSANAEFVRHLLEATRIDKCDFGIAYDEGFLALLPHLSPMRAAARILALDAHRLIAEGKPDDAAERIAGIYRMAGHLRSDNVLISSLVSIAIASLADHESVMFAEAGKLTDQGRAAIIAALQPLNREDGFGTKQCIDMERRIAVDYLRRTLTGDKPGQKLLDLNVVDLTEVNKDEIGALTAADVTRELDLMEKAYRDVLGIWDSREFAKESKALGDKISHREYGLLAQIFLPSLSRAKDADTKAADELHAALAALAKPAAKAQEPANPG